MPTGPKAIERTARLTEANNMRQATEDEIRRWYREQGQVIIVRRTGKILYRTPPALNWSEGRYVSDYHMTEEGLALT